MTPKITSYRDRKFAIVSHILPPAWSGQAVVLYRLLQCVLPEEYCLVTSGCDSGNATPPLPAQCMQLDKPLKGWGYLAALSGPWAGKVAARQVERRARQIERILRNNDIRLLVACSGDLLDIPAGAVAAKRVGVAFVPYLFDDYLHQWVGWRRSVALELERMALVGAAGALVPNEFLAAEYFRRYGILCQVVRNPALQQSNMLKPNICKEAGGHKRIVYTGSIYHAHYDAFLNLVKMLEKEGTADLHIYTAQSATELARHGIAGPYVHIRGHIGQEEALKVQQAADILFLPLAFSSKIPQVLRTSAPGKMGEYLASGTPILVHAPADSFLSWFFRKYSCGEVVDVLDCDVLANAVQRLLGDSDEVVRMIAQARQVAATEFAYRQQAEIFYKYVQTIIGRVC